MRIVKHPALFIVVDLLLILCCLNMRDSATGWFLWWSFFGPPLLVVCALMKLKRPAPTWTLYLWLLLFSTFFTFSLGEGALAAVETLNMKPAFTMPKEWERIAAPVSDAPDSFMWQGAFHLKDKNGMRHQGEWLPTSKIRIIVIGDSLTYGLGVKEEDTYPAQLQRLLGDKYQVLNLGIVGLNSTQILNVLKEYVPLLKPDLIIYGVCLNDFLPATKAQEKGSDDYSPPIPYWIRDPLITRTRLGGAMNTGYEKLLLSLSLRQDFMDEILATPAYQSRFQIDVVAMERLAADLKLPPIVGMVLDQYPQEGSRNQRLAEIAEEMMTNAGMNVLYSRSYYHAHSGHSFFVSPWEGHPNAEGYGLFAHRLADAINN